MSAVSIETLIEHPHIWRGLNKRFAAAVYTTGFKELDACLPGGGWPAAALTEIVLEHHGIGELSLLMPAMAGLCRRDIGKQAGGWILWVSPPFIPYAPALSKHGIDLNRVLLVHAPAAQYGSLWAMEQALRAGSCVAVLAWTQSADQTALRRLQLAAERAGCWAVLFRPGMALHQRSPAALRLKLCRHGDVMRIEILKCRGGRPGVVQIHPNGVSGTECS